MRFKLIIALVLTVLLASGQSVASRPESSVRFKLPSGSTVTLHQDLEIEAGRSRIYIQQGETANKIRHTYEPYCYFQMRRPRSEMKNPARILADTFNITRQRRENEMSAGREYLLADASKDLRVPRRLLLAGGLIDQPVNMNYSLRLESASQPQVHKLVCGIYAEPFYNDGVSVADMRIILEGFVSINLGG